MFVNFLLFKVKITNWYSVKKIRGAKERVGVQKKLLHLELSVLVRMIFFLIFQNKTLYAKFWRICIYLVLMLELWL